MTQFESTSEEKRVKAAEISSRYHFSQKPFLDVVFVPSGMEEKFISFVKEKFDSAVLEKNICPGGVHFSLKSVREVDWDLVRQKFES